MENQRPRLEFELLCELLEIVQHGFLSLLLGFGGLLGGGLGRPVRIPGREEASPEHRVGLLSWLSCELRCGVVVGLRVVGHHAGVWNGVSGGCFALIAKQVAVCEMRWQRL